MIKNPVTAEQILAAFEANMRHRPDIGVMNQLMNVFLEPRNPFESGRRRRPKRETLLLGILFAAVIAALLFFNLAALA